MTERLTPEQNLRDFARAVGCEHPVGEFSACANYPDTNINHWCIPCVASAVLNELDAVRAEIDTIKENRQKEIALCEHIAVRTWIEGLTREDLHELFHGGYQGRWLDDAVYEKDRAALLATLNREEK